MVDRVAVLGAGTMGSQIAGLLADRGIPCDLLDLRSSDEPDKLARAAIDRLRTLRPAPVSDPSVLALITPGNFDDHLDRLSGADLVIEAVSEDLEIKRAIWSRAAQHVRSDAVISTNTSGIPVSSIAEALPKDLRPRFLGAHFCNPPRYLPLLELISTPDTDPAVASTVYDISANVLQRGVVPAHDVPNFIANTIGVYALMAIVHAANEFGLAFDEVDAITGPAMGRPVSATFRTLDVVGIDVFMAVADNSLAAAEDDEERRVLAVPGYMREMVARGWTGQKAGQGFYRRVQTENGREILVLDPETLEYGPRSGHKAPQADVGESGDDPRVRLAALATSDSDAGRFVWRILSQMMVYSATKVGDVADDIISIDRAMRWGYAWELGPFETWDAIGLSGSLPRMDEDGLRVPGWVKDLAGSGGSFYKDEPGGRLQADTSGGYAPVPPPTIPE